MAEPKILRFASPAEDYLGAEAKARAEFLTEGYPEWQDKEESDKK